MSDDRKPKLGGLGAVIKELRVQKDVTQEQLAAALGVRQSTISMIETGDNSPSLELLLGIARELGATLDSIVVALGEPTPEATATTPVQRAA